MPEKNPNENEARPSQQRADAPIDEDRGAKHKEQTTEEWFAGIGAGLKGVSRGLLEQVPPEIRKKVIEQARSHGPGGAAVAVNAAAMKTRNLKLKIVLKTLGGLLTLLDSKDPKK